MTPLFGKLELKFEISAIINKILSKILHFRMLGTHFEQKFKRLNTKLSHFLHCVHRMPHFASSTPKDPLFYNKFVTYNSPLLLKAGWNRYITFIYVPHSAQFISNPIGIIRHFWNPTYCSFWVEE